MGEDNPLNKSDFLPHASVWPLSSSLIAILSQFLDPFLCLTSAWVILSSDLSPECQAILLLLPLPAECLYEYTSIPDSSSSNILLFSFHHWVCF